MFVTLYFIYGQQIVLHNKMRIQIHQSSNVSAHIFRYKL